MSARGEHCWLLMMVCMNSHVTDCHGKVKLAMAKCSTMAHVRRTQHICFFWSACTEAHSRVSMIKSQHEPPQLRD